MGEKQSALKGSKQVDGQKEKSKGAVGRRGRARGETGGGRKGGEVQASKVAWIGDIG